MSVYILKGEIMKVLFFRIGAIGDVLLTTGAVKAFKKAFPDCEVHYMAGRSAARILENNPYIDKLIIFEEKFMKVPRFMRAFLMASAIKKSIAPYYDYFIDFESSHYTAMIAAAVKAGKKAGFLITGKNRGYNRFYRIRFDYRQKNEYIARKYGALLSIFGIKQPESINPVLKLTQEEILQGAKFYEDNVIKRPVIHVCISGTWITKKWPVEKWKELLPMLAQNFDVIVLWGPGDEKDLSELTALKIPGIYFTPSLGLRQLAAVLSFGKLLITNDNGVRHIAGALALKTIGLFGPTNEKGWADINENNIVLTSDDNCRPCDKTSCPDLKCMTGITAQRVMSEAERILKTVF